MARQITAPLTPEVARSLRAGESVLLSGTVYTARDAAHKRLCQLVAEGTPLPFPIEGSVIYYVGPTPARPGQAIGSAGPTSSYRMDAYAPTLLDLGELGMIGKGHLRHQAQRRSLLRRHRRRRGPAVPLRQVRRAGVLRGSRRRGHPETGGTGPAFDRRHRQHRQQPV